LTMNLIVIAGQFKLFTGPCSSVTLPAAGSLPSSCRRLYAIYLRIS